MPALLAPAIAGLVGTLGAGSVVAGAIGTIGANVIVAGIAIGANFALNRLLQKKADKGSPQISQTTIRQPTPPRQRLYGRYKVGGYLFLENAIPTVNQPLIIGIVHFEGPADAIEAWFFNDSNCGLTPIVGSNNQSVGANLALPWGTLPVIESRLGQVVPQDETFILTTAGWHGKLNGLCYTVVQFNQPFNPPKNFQYFYPTGIPSIRVLARGARLYDPRNVAHDWNNWGTWEWSTNPALVILDYLTYSVVDGSGISIPRGMGLPKSRINIASFSAFADVCDESMPTRFIVDSSGNWQESAGTEPRYSCSILYDLSETPTDVLNRMLETCDATLYTLPDGTVGIRGGKWTSPTFIIDDSMILQAELAAGNDKFESFNQVKLQFTATNLDYQLVEGSPFDDFTSQIEVGVLSHELTLPGVQSYSQARRLAKIAMAKGNPQWRYSLLVCSAAVLDALGDEFVHVTHSLPGIDEDFLIIGFSINPISLTCTLQLVSIDSSAYDWSTLEDLPPPALNSGTIISIPETPYISQILSGVAAGGVLGGPTPVRLTFGEPAGSAPVDYYQLDHAYLGAPGFTTVNGLAGANSIIVNGYNPGDTIVFQVRAVNAAGVSGTSTQVTYTIGTTGTGTGSVPVLTMDSTATTMDHMLPTMDAA